MPLRGLILIAFFVASLPVCFVRPFYGIVLWTIVAFLNPQRYTWSAEAFPWALAVAIPTIVGAVVFARGGARWMRRECVLICILWAWFVFTSIISTSTPLFQHHAAGTWERLGFVSKVLLMTLISVAVVKSFDQLRILVRVVAGCFGFFVAKAFPFIVMTGGVHRLYGPERSMIGDNNDLGLALNMTLPLFFFLAKTETNPWIKRLFAVLFVITIPAIFCTYSRGALVGLVVVLGLMFLQVKGRMVLVPAILVAVLAALLFAPEQWKNRMDLTRSDTVDASARSRLNAWTFSWRLASDYPVTGGGFDTFSPQLFAQYADSVADIHGPHSVYFGILAEHGFVGLFLYLSLVLSCFATARQLVKHARYIGHTLVMQYAYMFTFSLVGFLTSGIFLGRAYFDYFFLIVACLVILKNVVSDDDEDTEEIEEATGEEAETHNGVMA